MKMLVVFLLGFVLRAAIILSNPIVWGGDTIIRLFDRHTLLKSYQLPLLQVLISGVSTISMNPRLVQFLMAVIGAIAGVGFYLLAADFIGEKFALPAALLFVTHPYILAVSTVPFQEILMLAALFFAFHLFYNEHWIAASLLLAAFARLAVPDQIQFGRAAGEAGGATRHRDAGAPRATSLTRPFGRPHRLHGAGIMT